MSPPNKTRKTHQIASVKFRVSHDTFPSKRRHRLFTFGRHQVPPAEKSPTKHSKQAKQQSRSVEDLEVVANSCKLARKAAVQVRVCRGRGGRTAPVLGPSVETSPACKHSLTRFCIALDRNITQLECGCCMLACYGSDLKKQDLGTPERGERYRTH